MSDKKTTETDMEILRRVMSEPTFKAVADALRRENAKREQSVRDLLRDAALKGEAE